jgi:hypothetical protein
MENNCPWLYFAGEGARSILIYDVKISNYFQGNSCKSLVHMAGSHFKKAVCWIFLGGLLLLVAACSTAQPWWQGKPITQMTPAELEEQDPTFWKMWGGLHGLGK